MDTKTHFTAAMACGMLADFRTLNSIGIVNSDVKEDNYMDGKMVDFSVAWTVPHYRVAEWQARAGPDNPDPRDARGARDEMTRESRCDMELFGGMIDGWDGWKHPRIWLRCFPNSDMRDRLRPRPHAYKWSEVAIKWPDAFAYDWKAAEAARDDEAKAATGDEAEAATRDAVSRRRSTRGQGARRGTARGGRVAATAPPLERRRVVKRSKKRR